MAVLQFPSRNGSAEPPRRLLGADGKPIEGDDGLLLPHQKTFAAIINAFNRTYSYRYDEALRDSHEMALCMRRDPFIWGCLDERYSAVCQAPWSVEPDDPEDAGQVDVASELTKLVEAIPWLTGMFRNLEEAAWYGRYGSQIQVGDVDVNGVTQRGIVYHRPVNGDKIQVGWDGIPRIMLSPTAIDGLKARGAKIENEKPTVITGERSPLLVLDKQQWRERFLINQFERDDADYYEGEMAGAVGGVGIRSRIYWGFWMRDKLMTWAVNYMQKVGTLGLLVFPFDEGNPDSQAAAERNIRESGNRSALAVPVTPGQSAKDVAPFLLSPSTAGIDALTAMIDSYWERHIERYIVGQNMSDGSDNESGLGGTGRSKFAANSKYHKIKGDADRLGETLTKDLLKPLHRWNYAKQRFTYKFVFGIPDPEAAERLKAGTDLVTAGVPILADELREAGGFSKPKEGEETVGGQQTMEDGTVLGPDGKRVVTATDEKQQADQAMKQKAAESYAYVESEHPRAADGEWTDKGTAGISNDKPVRFERGKKLTPDERKEVLRSIKDRYKETGHQKEVVGINPKTDEEIYRYPYDADRFVTSSVTGAKVRHYVTLPGGSIAHPSELFPEITQSDVLKAVGEAEHAEKTKKEFEQARLKRLADTKQDANQQYAASGRPLPHSYFAESPDGKIVRVDGTDVHDVEYFDNAGYRRLTTPNAKDDSDERTKRIIAANHSNVPPEVLSQYPDLAAKYAKKSKPTATNYQREREEMNDKQFAAAMDRLDGIVRNMSERHEMTNYQRVESGPVAPPNTTINFSLPAEGVHFHLPQEAFSITPTVNVTNEVPAPVVNVVNEVQPAAVNVAAPVVNVEAPVVNVANTVDVPKPDPAVVNLTFPDEQEYDVVPVRDELGNVTKYKRVPKV